VLPLACITLLSQINIHIYYFICILYPAYVFEWSFIMQKCGCSDKKLNKQCNIELSSIVKTKYDKKMRKTNMEDLRFSQTHLSSQCESPFYLVLPFHHPLQSQPICFFSYPCFCHPIQHFL